MWSLRNRKSGKRATVTANQSEKELKRLFFDRLFFDGVKTRTDMFLFAG